MITQVRVNKIDAIRGSAILIMFLAHALPYIEHLEIYKTPTLRIFNSLSAPLFLFLVGFNTKKENYFKTLQKGLFVLFLAVFIDLFIWKIIPFYSFDVLYIISFSIISSILWVNLEKRHLYILAITLILIAFGYQYSFNYDKTLNEPELNQIEMFDFWELMKNMFFDGWFPVFPWFSIIIIGFIFKKYYLSSKKLLLIGICLFVLGIFFYLKDSPAFIRSFAIEIFYPFNPTYLLISIGWILLIFNLQINFDNKFFKPLNLLGRTSIFMYLFHLTIYHFFFEKVFTISNSFSLTFFLFVLVFIISAYIINYMKQKSILPSNNFVVLLLGK